LTTPLLNHGTAQTRAERKIQGLRGLARCTDPAAGACGWREFKRRCDAGRSVPKRLRVFASAAGRIASDGLGLGAAACGHGIPGRGQFSPVAVSTSAALATVSVMGSTSKIAVTAIGSWAAGACVTTETCGIHDVGW
jgi:hypothetical protein